MFSKLKVMVVDDTALYRKILKDIINETGIGEVIASAANGALALRMIPISEPELILLDVEMPEMDGLSTLKEIKRLHPKIGVVMISGISEGQAETTVQALQYGAVDFITKPISNSLEENYNALRNAIVPMLNIYKTRALLKGLSPSQARALEPSIVSAPKAERFTKPTKFDILVIGVSTGGPNALAEFIPKLPKDLNVPVLIVQHMPPIFTKSLADHLGQKSILPVKEAEDGEFIEKNKVYIAPGGKHMIIRKDNRSFIPVISITDTAPVNSCKPSVDVLFSSVPNFYNGNILSVVMTGMGADGLQGVKNLQKIGCYTLTQSEDSCIVWGMPRAVYEAGFSDETVHLNKLASRVTELVLHGLK